MKHISTFDTFLNESEIKIFDQVGEPLQQIIDSIDALLKDADKIQDPKWVTALKTIQTQCNKLESTIAQADTKLGVIPMNEAMVQIAGKSKPSGAKVLATVLVQYMEENKMIDSNYTASAHGGKNQKFMIDQLATFIMDNTF